MIVSLRVVTVYVSDQERALDFYVGRLGFVKQRDNEYGPGVRRLEVKPLRAETALALVSASPEDYQAGRIPALTGMVFAADDVALTYEDLRRRGVPFTGALARQPWGRLQAQFQDPDGNTFILVQADAY